MKITWRTEKRKVVDLIPAEYNPRKLSEKARADLIASIKEFSEVEPVVINTDNKLIGGHQRVSIYADLQIEEIDVRVPSRNLNLEEEMRLNIRLNKNTGEWDDSKLLEWDPELLEGVGFSKEELTDIFDGVNVEDKDFDLETELVKTSGTKIQYGEMYKLGEHTIMCGDATKEEDVKKLMGGVKANMVFTDPPYNVDYQGSMNSENQNKREGIKNDKMSTEQFYTFMDRAIKNLLDNTVGAFYICMSSKELASLKDVFEKNGGHWQSFIIWVKNTFTLSRSDWQNQYEPILYGWNGDLVNHYFAGMRDEGNVWENLQKMKPQYDGVETTIKIGGYHLKLKGQVEGKVCRKNDSVDIWHENKPTKSAEHPTMKPLKLCAKGIKASSLRGGIVLDTFLGSGSTLIAAQETGRICHGMELDPQYVQVIINRWEKLTGEKAVKI